MPTLRGMEDMQDKTLKCDLYQYLLDDKYGDGDLPGISNEVLAIIEDMVKYGLTPLRTHFLAMLLAEMSTLEPKITQIIRENSTHCPVCGALNGTI